ncbi:MAG: ABC transporter ATP-binding protein [Mailhella sp.]|nr:ABC transporter ATP-binding protein [Mailhella sp.]
MKKYIFFAIAAALFMAAEVLMDLLLPGLMQSIVDDAVLGIGRKGVSDTSLVCRLGLIMAVIAAAGGICGSMNNVFVQIASQNIGNAMRKDCFRRCMGFSFQQMDRLGIGSLITRLTYDITQVQTFIAQFVRGGVRTAMMLGGSVWFMFMLNRQFGLIVLAVMPLLLSCIVFCIARVMPLFPKMQAQLDRLNEIIQEDASGLRMIKACSRETYEELRFGNASKALAGTMMKTLLLFACMNPVMNLLMSMAIVAIIYAGSLQVGSGAATPGAVMAGITYTARLLNALLMLMMLFQNITRGYASWKRVRKILMTEPEMLDGPFDGETELRGQVEFRDVSFSFHGAEHPVLQHVSLTIHPGETVAVMGATGSGKTTMLSLIPRFYDVSKGCVLVDGVDVRQYRLSALRRKTAFALQKSELFSTSLKDNIAWACPDAPDKDIARAAEIARLSDFINLSDEGWNMPVAERGMSLSGGQRQRVSIARTLLKKAEILLLDDATSALDLKTEAELEKALGSATPKMTRIIVAQRVASVRGADRIIVLDHGGIAGCGTHETLLQSCPAYKEICSSQLGGSDGSD